MDELFGAAPMYDEDYLYFFAAASGFSEVAMHGPNLPGAGIAGEVTVMRCGTGPRSGVLLN
jgi:hypothetical protein